MRSASSRPFPLRPLPSRSRPGPWGLLALVTLVWAVQPLPVEAQDTSLQVSGSAQVEASPDRARISFAVETEAETAGEAGRENAELMDRVANAIRESGVDGLRIETSGYQLQPRYRRVSDDRRQEIYGYTARNTLQVIVDDVDAVGGLVDRALDAGANRVAGLQFEIRDPEPYRLEALRLAVERARAEAEAMAGALGMRLGQPREVQGGAERPQPRAMMDMLRMETAEMASAPTPVEAGLQTVSASVSITYRLHPER
jgi:uncharacterized protein